MRVCDSSFLLVDFACAFLFELGSQSVHFSDLKWFFDAVLYSVAVVAALEGVRVDDAEFLKEDNSSTSLLIHLFESISRFHMFATEVALLVLEVDTILADYAWKQVALNLKHEVINGVSKDKTPFTRWMCVQVDIHK